MNGQNDKEVHTDHSKDQSEDQSEAHNKDHNKDHRNRKKNNLEEQWCNYAPFN